MHNLGADMEQKYAQYRVRPNHFRIEIYISNNRNVVMIGRKDSNYTEWLSTGQLNPEDTCIGECISNLMANTPLDVSTSLYWKSYEEATGRKYEELHVFSHLVMISKDSEGFVMNNERVSSDATPGEIQHRLIEFYEQFCEATVEGPANEIGADLQRALAAVRAMAEACAEPGELGPVSNNASRQYDEMKIRYAYCREPQVRRMLLELFHLSSSIYNRYMTAVR